MKRAQYYIFTYIHLAILILSFITNWYGLLSILLVISLIAVSLYKLGKGIILRELIALFGCFICLLMPVVGYLVYNKNNALAKLWLRYMPVPEDVYFEYALPAMAAFVLTLCFPLTVKGISDEGEELHKYIPIVRKLLFRYRYVGVYIAIIGSLAFGTIVYLPESFQFLATLLYFCAFSGFLYIYFTPVLPYKKWLLSFFAIFILSYALSTGMFTIVAYMGITLFSFFFLGKKIKTWKKISAFVLGAAMLILIQSVKISYRKTTWRGEYEGNKALLFGGLMVDKLSEGSALFSSDAFFPTFYRTNQGYNVALVMRRFPDYVPFDNGRYLGETMLASVVPRVFWPDKPIAGGKFNMRYYAGINLRGWSTNVGPLGEAYGAFGVTGGIVFMFLLGWFIRWAYQMVFVISRKLPLFMFWIPVLFYQITYAAEADTLQIFNSLFKATFFLWVLYKILPKWFGVLKRHEMIKTSTPNGYNIDNQASPSLT